MNRSVPLFEAKAHFSRLVRQVVESGQEVVVTVRGKPSVRIVPTAEQPDAADAWTVRERVAAEYGAPDFVAPLRSVDTPSNPFADDNTT